MAYETVIGLEVHAQLLTESKIFCSCRTAFGAEPNTQTCPVCLGLPGVLPVANKKVVDFALKMALATDCHVNKQSVFARKNYFYPDLPKGYQISQYEEPLSENGWIGIETEKGKKKNIRILRIHIEEDAGKSVHDEVYVHERESLMDFNRCGVPLIEIVSEPDMRSPREAACYLTKIRQLVRWLNICDGNMEEGSLRCDANISLRLFGADTLGVKTELKNMNSISGVEKALTAEVRRQTEILQGGGQVIQQTLLWDENKGNVIPMRGKEEAHDYRYFPDPDLVPISVNQVWIQKTRQSLPEMPERRRKRWIDDFGLPEYDALVLTEDRAVADYFEALANLAEDPKQASNWVMGEVLRCIKEENLDIENFSVRPQTLSDIIRMIRQGTISHTAGKKVFDEVLHTGASPEKAIEKLGLTQVSDASTLDLMVQRVLEENPAEVQKFLSGHEKVLGFLMGQIMKASQGKANPGLVNEILKKKLGNMA